MKGLYYLIIGLCVFCLLSFFFTTEINYKDDPSVAIVFCIKTINCPNKPLISYSDKYVFITSLDESYILRDFYIINQKYGYIFIILLLFILSRMARIKDNN